MCRLNCSLNRRRFVLTVAVLGLLCGPMTAPAQLTIPVMTDYFDTGDFGSTAPTGITSLPSTCNFAIVDAGTDEVYIVNALGILQSQFDTAPFATSPTGITFDPTTGYFAIVDNSADEVFFVDNSGALRGVFDTLGFGSPSPTGITYDATTDNFAIVDNSADEIFFVTRSGVLVGQCDTSPFSPNPNGITFDPTTGDFAVVDASGAEVFIVDSSCVVQDQWDTAGSVSTQPVGITLDPCTENLVIVDPTQDEVFFFDDEGTAFAQCGTTIFGSTSPTGIAYVSTTGEYAVVDSIGDEVFFVDSSCNLQGQCDTSGFSNDPSDIAFDEDTGRFAIVDPQDDKVYIIDSQCALIDQLDLATFGINLINPTGIADVPGSGRWLLTDSSRDVVITIDPSLPGRLRDQFSTIVVGSTSAEGITRVVDASSVPIFDTGLLAIVDNSADEVFVVDSRGVLRARFDTSIFSPTNPRGIAFDSASLTFAIVDSDADKISFLNLPSLNVPPINPVCEGDLTGDDTVNFADLAIMKAEFFRADCP